MTAGFDYSIVEDVSHRPFPLPPGPWLMTQSWHDLLFAHWRVNVDQVRRSVPRALDLDLFEGDAWLGIVPFRMSNVGVRALPGVPGASAFPELNVRTYVRVGDRPGVFFFSLDAASALAVAAARTLLNLPYHTADMAIERREHAFVYRSARRSGRAAFAATYEPAGEPFVCVPGSLEYFLTERYCLYHHDRRGRPYRLDIHHPPWRLQAARAGITVNTMADGTGVTLAGAPALLHVAQPQDVIAWAPTRVAGAALR